MSGHVLCGAAGSTPSVYLIFTSQRYIHRWTVLVCFTVPLFPLLSLACTSYRGVSFPSCQAPLPETFPQEGPFNDREPFTARWSMKAYRLYEGYGKH